MADLFARPQAFIDLGTLMKSFMAMLALCSARFYTLSLIFPPMGDQGLTGNVRNGVCLTLGFFMAWGQPLQAVADLDVLHLTALILKEGALGLVLGFAASTVFWIAEAAGGLVDNQAGFNSVQQSNPATGAESTPVGNLMGQLASSCFWILGGMTTLISVVFESYHWWPMMKIEPEWSNVLLQFTQVQMSSLMRTLVTLAAPMMFVLVLVDLGFGIIAKTADKLEPNSLGQPVKGAVALLMVSLLVALFFQETKPMLALHHLQQDFAAWLEVASRTK